MSLLHKGANGLTVAATEFRDWLSGLLMPHERLSPSAWCEKYLVLPGDTGEKEPGKVSFSRRSYMREIIDQMDDASVTDIIVVGPTRVGKTFILRCALMWALGVGRASAMWVDATERTARKVSETEIQPMVRANPAVASLIAPGRFSFTKLWMVFRGAVLTMVGSNSPNSLAGFTATYLFGNEVGKWRAATSKEADAISLSRSRTKDAIGERKNIYSSTPTNADDQGVYGWFERGDQRRWHIGCKSCAAVLPLEFSIKHVVWDQDARDPETNEWDIPRCMESARYKCQACGHLHTQVELDELKAGVADGGTGRFIPTAEPKEPGVVSFQLDGLLGVTADNTMGGLVKAFLSAKQTGWYGKIRDFWNSYVGKPHVDNLLSMSVDAIRHILADYRQGALPAGWVPDGIILGHDMQEAYIPWLAVGFKWSGEFYIIDHGNAGALQDIADIAKKLGCSYVIGDSNYEARVAEQMRFYQGRSHLGWILAEAFEVTKQHLQVIWTDPYKGTADQGKTPKVPVLRFGDYDIKLEIEKRLQGEIQGLHCYSPEPGDAGSKAAVEGLLKQFLGQARERRKKWQPGQLPWQFVTKGDDHWLDCLVYVIALFAYLQMTKSTAAERAKAAPAKKPAGPRVVGKIG